MPAMDSAKQLTHVARDEPQIVVQQALDSLELTVATAMECFVNLNSTLQPVTYPESPSVMPPTDPQPILPPLILRIRGLDDQVRLLVQGLVELRNRVAL